MGKKKEAKKLAALAAREAELAAELERRKAAKKKAKKKAEKPSKKKGKKKAKHIARLDDGGGMSSGMVDAGALGVMTISAEAPIATEVVATMDGGEATVVEPPVVGYEDGGDYLGTSRAENIGTDGKTKPEVIAKRKKNAATEAEKLDAEIKDRLAAKKAARKEGKAAIVAEAETIDLSDHDAVMAYNLRAVAVGATMLTSDQEREKIANRQTAEEVATEEGRVFEVGQKVSTIEGGEATITFAKPSDAAPELEEGRNGYKIIQLGADGKPDPKKVRQLTRVTTFVNNIDDETTLKKWDKRMVVEGLAVDAFTDHEKAGSYALVSRINDIVHRRDVAIAKATKADRKGKLGIGEVGALIAAASKEAKDALDKIVEEAAEIAGRNKKARAGTHLHTLAEISDAQGVDAVRIMHEDGTVVHDDETGEDVPVTETDLASIEAYAERMARLGARVIESEAVIVNDAMGYAGRLDRIIMCKLPELTLADGTVRPADQRAKRYVADLKSGRVDLGAGKIARQLAAYALGDLYDVETGARSRHSASRDVALVFHLPQGEGVCRVHAVDLKAGTALLKLSAEVRRARNTGKKTIDTSVDIADPAPEEEA